MLNEPSPKQLALLRRILRYQLKHGFPPSIRELARLQRVSSTNGVKEALDRLQRDKLLARRRGDPRAMRILKRGFQAMEREAKS